MLRKDPFITDEYYHIYNRGIDKRVIFKANRDYERFMMLLYLANSDDSFRLDNILDKQNRSFIKILLLDKGITKFMKKLGTGYSMYFNIRYERKGALFGGLFKSKLIGVDDNYLRHLFGYIHINPLEIRFPDWENKIKKPSADMATFLKSYRYSSYRDYTGEDRIERRLLNPENFPDYFKDSKSFQDFVENYFVN